MQCIMVIVVQKISNFIYGSSLRTVKQQHCDYEVVTNVDPVTFNPMTISSQFWYTTTELSLTVLQISCYLKSTLRTHDSKIRN
jgi:hypothetical protein